MAGNEASNPFEPIAPEVGRQIARALNGLRYGSVEVVVHDGKVVQIERHEKVRLDGDGPNKKKEVRG